MLMRPLVLMDFDGVLADSLTPFSTAFLDSCRDEGITALQTRNDFLDLFDGNLYEELERRGISPDQQKAILRRLAERLSGILPNVPLFPHAPTLLRTLSDLSTLYIVTSNRSEIVASLLEREGLREAVREVWGADREPRKVLKIQSLRHRHPDGAAYYVGDTAGDIREARAAGAIPIAVTWGWHDADRLRTARPAYLFERPEALLAFFRNMRSL